MRKMKMIPVLGLLILSLASCQESSDPANIRDLQNSIPLAANSWVGDHWEQTRAIVSKSSVQNWTDEADTISTWFHTDTIGELSLALVGMVPEGTSRLGITLNGQERKISMDRPETDTVYVGSFRVSVPGYQEVRITGLKKSAGEFAELSTILIGGPATEGELNYVRDDIYWGRRGPSVHLGYPVPEDFGDVRWFYNEITVPEGEDVLGSYFMANGFSTGYFGIQVNSETERRILFSVWSPFHTDDPKEIPEDQRIVMLKKGDEVYTGEFGNEGSGGQSFLRYDWKAGVTYGFLLKGEPVDMDHTVYTAWFHAPEEGWKLIASFKRPRTHEHLSRLHSFLENFYTETGATSRMACYGNQWARNTQGEWTELTRARFTADATARKQARLDYSGGDMEERFYLKNCGFTNDHTEIGSMFEREATGQEPRIPFSDLP